MYLPTVDLTGKGVGATGTISLKNTGLTSDLRNSQVQAHLRLYNDSGCGLQLTFPTGGKGDILPAGGWATYELSPGENQVNWTVLYALPNPPVSVILPVYYYPGEQVPAVAQLGNSPIGGGVSTSAIQTLSNENSAPGALVIDIGNTTVANLLNIFNDHFLWSVLQSGVAHQVLKGQTAGNPLQVGQAGDISEVLGQLTVDQLLTAVGNIIANGGINVGTIRDNTTGATQATLVTAGITIANALALSSQLNMADAGSTFSGVSGSLVWVMPLRGSGLKIFYGNARNYRETANHDLLLPVAFANGALAWIGFFVNPANAASTGVQFMSGGVAQTVNGIQAAGLIPSSASSSGGTGVWRNGICEVDSGFDTIRIAGTANWTAGGNGNILIIGN